MYSEDLIKIVTWLAASVLAVDFVLVGYILCRRLLRANYFRKKDEASLRLSGAIGRFLAGEMPVEALVLVVRAAHGRAARTLIQERLFQSISDANRKTITDIFVRLGYVEHWAKQAFGRRRGEQLIEHILHGNSLPPAGKPRWAAIRRMRLFCIRRSHAVAKLGRLDQEFAQVFMREALLDPSPYVERADVAAMGHNRQVHEIPILLGLLQKAAEGNGDLPVSEVKTALARYSIGDLEHFIPFLDKGSPNFRFVLVDTIREICDMAHKAALAATDFPESLYRWFLDHARLDSCPDVRARSVRVVRHFHNSEAAKVMRTLMADMEEFVRLHAVRACADPYYSNLLGDLVQRTTDPKWRVREAAVKTLATFGEAGQRELAHRFLSVTDDYASEQIAEQMQRNGMIAAILPDLGTHDGKTSLANDICAKLVHLHKTSFLTDLLLQNGPSLPRTDCSSSGIALTENARARLLEILLAEPTPALIGAVERLASRQRDDLSETARSVLNRDAHSGLAATASSNGRH